MKLAYVSPSVLPSRSANSVHVVHQCEALGEKGVDVTLFAKRAERFRKPVDLAKDVREKYGVHLSGVSLSTLYTPWARAHSFLIALYALPKILGGEYDFVLSRNLFLSFFLSLISRYPAIIEVHQVEKGVRGWIQRIAFRGRNVSVVAISEQLSRDLLARFGESVSEICVLHDAAPKVGHRATESDKLHWRRTLLSEWTGGGKFICGYVGHLYPGRGIEIIEALAHECPDVFFIVVGGIESHVIEKRRLNVASNLVFLGHVSHPNARKIMSAVDLLLMPYQEQVSIGIAGHETGRWMSPMKMFEYMSSGTSFVASNLPVLREVLVDGVNSLLVPCDSVSAWRDAIYRLRDDPVQRNGLAEAAYNDYRYKYTWSRRAERLIKIMRA